MIKVCNVVLISVDELRADQLSYSGYHRETSPVLDTLAAESVVFSYALSVSSHTREAVSSLLTGRYSDEAADSSYHLSAPTLPSYCDASTASAAFHSNPYVSRAYGYGTDFDLYSDDMRIGSNKLVVLLQRAIDKLRNSHYARAPAINERSLDWVADTDKPRFVWNHYMDTHGPYEAPKRYQLRFRDEFVSPRRAQKLYKRAIRNPESITEEERQVLLDLYDAEITYFDEALGDFLNRLHEMGHHHDTLLIITADHGEAFGEHGYYEHPRRLPYELLHVPLLVVHPALDPVSIQSPVSTLDIVPTILDTFDICYSGLDGTSLWKIVSDPDEYADRTVYAQARGENEEANLIRFAAYNRVDRCEQLRDIESGEPAGLDVGDADRALIEDLERHSSVRMSHLDSTGSSSTENEEDVDDAVESRLEALGYKER